MFDMIFLYTYNCEMIIIAKLISISITSHSDLFLGEGA